MIVSIFHNAKSMIYYLSVACLLGLSAGLSPGPLLSLVLSESLRHGAASGVRVACAPLISDAPIILLSWCLVTYLAAFEPVLGAISIAGAVVVGFVAVSSFKYPSIETNPAKEASRSLLKGVVVNLFNPQPYLFWGTVGAPLLVGAAELSLGLAAAFLAIFYLLLVGLKIILALIIGYYRNRFNLRIYRIINSFLGVVLLAFAVGLFWNGLVFLGVQ